MKKLLNILFLALIIFAADVNSALAVKKKAAVKAEEAVIKAEVTAATDEFEFKQISARLVEIEQNIKTDNFTRQSLESSTVYLNETELSLEGIIRKLEKESAYAQEALAAFGETSEDMNESDAAIAEMKEKYISAVNNYKNKLIEANLLKTEVMRTNAIITEARGRILIGNLVAQKNALVVPKTFFRAISDATVFFWNIAISPFSWYLNLDEDGRSELFHRGWYVLLLISLALSFGMFLRRYIINHWGYKRTVEQPGYGQKVGVAFVTAIAYGVIPSLLIGGCLLWEITNEDLIGSQFGKVLASAFYYALYIILFRAAIRVVLAPWNGRWRLLNISDARAERVFRSMTLSIILLGVIAYLRHLAQYFDTSDALNLLLAVSSDAAKAFVIMLVTVSVFGDIKTKAEEETEDKEDNLKDNDSEDEDSFSFSTRIIIFATLFALATFSISIFGYPDLANFIFNRFYASVFLCVGFFVVRTMIFDLLKRSIVFWIQTYRMRKQLLSKVDFLMSLLITPILLGALIYFMLRIWGMPESVFLYGLKKLFFGFKVGGINISLIAIITGLLVLTVSLILVRMLRNKLEHSVLRRINMDEGIKHSLVSGVSFIGFVISAIIAIVAMGVDLSNLAVIAGALSVGIGFGLQDIIKNLVSGIILLFERPFKVGDWVIIGGEEGLIKQINIRSTELETWTKRSVIIPNATLISSSVINLTHGDNWQRQSIIVGVSYDSDVKKVTEVLLECAKSNKKVAKVPAPMVIFKDFGASSLDFELRFHVANVRTDWSVGSDVRYAILQRFREENIEIAYPQIVVHDAPENAPAVE